MSPIDFNTSSAVFRTFEDSSKAVTSLENSADLKASYLGFSGSVSGSSALQTAFAEKSYVALFAYQYSRYAIQLINPVTLPKLLQPALLSELKALKQPFNKMDYNLVHAYDEFLFRWGSHIVTEVTFGQRFFFSITQSSTDTSKYEEFQASVEAEYNGLSASIKGDASTKNESFYKTYLEQKVQTVAVAGGDPSLHAALAMHPDNADSFTAWSGNRAAVAADKPTQVKLTSMAEVLAMVPDSTVSAYSEDMQAAIDFWGAKRTTVAPASGADLSRPCLFVRVKDAAKQGSCSLILSDDACAKIAPKSLEGMTPIVEGTSGDGFTYGIHGQSVSFTHTPMPPFTNKLAWFTPGFLARFDLTYGPSTTITLVADENIDYVIFASGQGRYSDWSGHPRLLSSHVYWQPEFDSPCSSDPHLRENLVLPIVDLGQGAQYRKRPDAKPESFNDPLFQFALWESQFGSSVSNTSNKADASA